MQTYNVFRENTKKVSKILAKYHFYPSVFNKTKCILSVCKIRSRNIRPDWFQNENNLMISKTLKTKTNKKGDC